MRKTNADLFKKLNQQEKQIATLTGAQNDVEQHGCKWNLRVFNIPESKPEESESSAEFAKKVCHIFSTLVGASVSEEDIEIAHRVGQRMTSGSTRCRAIIVRFHSRQKKDGVLANRRRLKGNAKKISIGEDLTYLNYRLLKDAKQHSATLDAWSSNGKVLAKLKNGKVMSLVVDKDFDTTLRSAM
ncbi:hypothetical protein ACOMHN_045469 [Nucella lapillus]